MPSSSSSKAEASSSSRKKSSGNNGKSSGSGGGQLTANEKRIYQGALNEPDHILTNEALQINYADIRVEDQLAAVNSLLMKSLFTVQKTNHGIQYQALSKGEASTLGSLDSDEAMIFSQIRDAGNEGIWTKQLKSRTNLHQTIMTRCLKALDGKALIKAVKSVKFPTRKIYMLYGLTPSIELTGGPWHTDHDFDAEYVTNMSIFIHRYIISKSWPKGQEGLFLASHTPSLPTASSIQSYIEETGTSITPLTVENVQDLLDVLIYDDKIEKVPCFPIGKVSTRKQDREYVPKRKKKGRRSRSESDSGSGSEEESKSDSGTESDESSSESDSGEEKRSRKRKRSKHQSRSASRDSKRHRSRSSSKHRKTKSGSLHKNSISAKSILLSDESEDEDVDEEEEEEENFANASIRATTQVFVYRAIRPFFVQSGYTEIPCCHCPVFSFCEPGGPVNAESCVYMKDWIYRCKASDVDGGEGESNGARQHIGDIEDVMSQSFTNGHGSIAAGEEVEDEDASLAHVSEQLPTLGIDEQDYDSFEGEEEV
ncbi:hypothetical protein CBS101457_001524 [Exobasidium rhododendri]|nr:hypothetical protein CBS101457_001524 [Exobasidium rhododendri]